MPSFLNIWLQYKRWRHGRGFGVHSPFAYRFVTEVLNLPDGYAYYAYPDLPDARLRTLFRVAVCLKPRKVGFIDCDSPEVRAAVFRAMPKAVHAPVSEADFIVFDARKNRKLSPDTIPATANVVIFNYSRWRARRVYAAMLPAGMIFKNGGSMAVIAALPHLPRQDFDVRF